MVQFLRLSLGEKYRVVTAEDGERGLELLRELRPDLVITDVLMPVLGGEGLIAAMRARPELHEIPVLVLTADADEALRVRVLENGAQDYLTKPFAVAELLARADLQIAMRRARLVLERELETKNASVAELAGELVKRGAELRTTVQALQRAREQAERDSEQKSHFLRLVTHELVTPLTAAKLGVDLVTRDPQLEPKHRARLEKVGASMRRLHALIESLLEHARIEAGVMARDIVAVELGALAGELVDEMRPLAEAKSLTLTFDAPRPAPLASDPRVIRLIVSNLLGNALKFTKSGGIQVRVGAAENAARLEVADSGPGIPPAEHGRIFDAFARVGADDDRPVPGVGLGLALVREMTALLGGTIEVRSEVGTGSVFTVVLPDLHAIAAEG
jgi:signal transduction histidine kinase